MASAPRFPLDAAIGGTNSAILSPPISDGQLQNALKYCAPSTSEAARQFRVTGRQEYLPAILHGVLTHYVEPRLRTQLLVSPDRLQLKEDLGLDSLTLMEIVIRLEDALQISVRDDELRQFRTVGEVRDALERAVSIAVPPSSRPGAPSA